MNKTATPLDHDERFEPMAETDNSSQGGSEVSNAAGGAAAGAIASLGNAQAIDPPQEDAYWREHFVDRPYVESGSSVDDYGPAFGYGVNAYTQYAGRSFDSIESDLSNGWSMARGGSKLDWYRARNATHDAWDRVSAADADRPS